MSAAPQREPSVRTDINDAIMQLPRNSTFGATPTRLPALGMRIRVGADAPPPAAQPDGDLHADARAVRDAMASVTGPFVLCGHSYGGAVITEAAVPSDDIIHLVYIAAAAPDAGQSLADLAPEPADDQGESVCFCADGMVELTRDAAMASLFHDCAPSQALSAVERLRPSNPAVGSQQVAAAGWREAPATFAQPGCACLCVDVGDDLDLRWRCGPAVRESAAIGVVAAGGAANSAVAFQRGEGFGDG